ncbi:MAG: SoxR reducing system RseC family protein [Luminiphilus sp.]|nr:SoxR reducing system RseC family protein [Luminiphilus sp.]
MLREIGRVVAVEATSVWVETIPSSLCGKCAARAGCGQGIVSRTTGHRGLVQALETSTVRAQDCRVDDEVEIELPESAVLKGSLLVYLAPLLFGITAVLFAQPYGEFATVVAFLTGLGVGFVFVRIATHWVFPRQSFEPRLSAVVQAPPISASSTVIARQ